MMDSKNSSVAETELFLNHLQSEITVVMIPALTFLSLLLVTGVIGNCLVLVVHSRKFPRTPLKLFVKCMAAYGLVTVIIAIPGEIYELLNKLQFNFPAVCKIKHFITAGVTTGSALLVLAVAIIRYMKICRPFGRQVSVTEAKTMITAIVITSLVLPIPFYVIHGSRKKETPRHDIHGYYCDVSDAYVMTIWPTAVMAFMMGIFVLCSTAMVVMYFLVAGTLQQHRTLRGTQLRRKHAGLTRTSCVLMALSLVFIVSFLPFFVLGLFNTIVTQEQFKSLGKHFSAFYHLFRVCFLLNGTLNPAVYSLCSVKFRNECVKLLCCRTKK